MLTGLATYERQAAAIAREVRLLRQDTEPAPSLSPVQLTADVGLSRDPWQRGVLAIQQRYWAI